MSAILHPPCDRGVVRCVAQHVHPPSGRAWVLAGTVLGSGLALVDGSAVNLTLPVIQQALGGGVEAAQWIMNAYMLFLSATVLAGGAAADRYGRKRVFVIGVALFTAASVACGLSPSLPALIATRTAQGMGAALLTPASLALLGAAYDPKGRGYRTAMIAAAVASALAALVAAFSVRGAVASK